MRLIVRVVLGIEPEPEIADAGFLFMNPVGKLHVDKLLLGMDKLLLGMDKLKYLLFFAGEGSILFDERMQDAVLEADGVVVGGRMNDVQYPVPDGVALEVEAAARAGFFLLADGDTAAGALVDVREPMAENGRSLGDSKQGAFVQQNLPFSESALQGLLKTRSLRTSADEQYRVDQIRSKPRVLQQLADVADRGGDEGGDELLKARACDLHVHIDDLALGVAQQAHDLDVGASLRAQPYLGLLDRRLQLSPKSVFRFHVLAVDEPRHVELARLSCLAQNEVFQEPIDVLAAQPHVAALALLDELTRADRQQRKVEGAAAEIEDQHGLRLVAFHLIDPEGNRRRGRLRQKPTDLQAASKAAARVACFWLSLK